MPALRQRAPRTSKGKHKHFVLLLNKLARALLGFCFMQRAAAFEHALTYHRLGNGIPGRA
jgi:hypothetical protein